MENVSISDTSWGLVIYGESDYPLRWTLLSAIKQDVKPKKIFYLGTSNLPSAWDVEQLACVSELNQTEYSHVLMVQGTVLLHPSTLKQHIYQHKGRDIVLVGRVSYSSGVSSKKEDQWEYLLGEDDIAVSQSGGRFLHISEHMKIPAVFSAPLDTVSKTMCQGYIENKKLEYCWASSAISYLDENFEASLHHWMLLSSMANEALRNNFLSGLFSGGFIPYPKYYSKMPVNIVTTNLGRGGAERIVRDIAVSLSEAEIPVNLYILWDRKPSFELPNNDFLSIYSLQRLEIEKKLRFIADMQACWPNSVLFAHLLTTENLKLLWKMKVKVVPIIHNAEAGWLNEPELYNNSETLTPFVVGCSRIIEKSLVNAYLDRPSTFIRHIPLEDICLTNSFSREEIRLNLGIGINEKLICMVGNFRAQKNYERAMEILSEVRKRIPVKLLILGGWFQNDGHGKDELNKMMRLALDLNLVGDVITHGSVYPVYPWLKASDVFLNCSLYEGYSMAAIEALQAGLPLVLSDVGGQAEIRGENVTLLPANASSYQYSEALINAIGKSNALKVPSSFVREQHLLWALISKAHSGLFNSKKIDKPVILFLTNNLYDAGAQRSLLNLITQKDTFFTPIICVREKNHGHIIPKLMLDAGIRIWDISSTSCIEIVDKVIEIIIQSSISLVVFWNFAPREKLLIAKVLELTNVGLVDVSPGSMYFDSLASAHEFAHAISMDLDRYASCLDAFVYKYSDGMAPVWFSVPEERCYLIPNGVEERPSIRNNPPLKKTTLSIGTASRITPIKQIDWLLDICTQLLLKDIEIYMHIIGGLEDLDFDYLDVLKAKFIDFPKLRRHVIFHGSSNDIWEDLEVLDIFILVSEPGGCPNASLEAMAAGIPVIATRAGGAPDQIEHNVNGFLVEPQSTEEVVDIVLDLFARPEKIDSISLKCQELVQQNFSMDLMVARYSDLFKKIIQSQKI